MIMMHKIKIEIPQEVQDLVQEVSDNEPDFDVYLSGGALRDYYCGLDPKDLDLMLVPKDNTLREAKYTPLRTIINYRKDASEISDMGDRGVHQLIGMKCYKIETSEVQYIVYGKYLTQKEVTSDMDMNITQVTWAAGDDFCLATDAFMDGHTHKVIQCLHKYDENRMVSRFNRMEKKFPEYTVIGKPIIEVDESPECEGPFSILAGLKITPEVKRAGGDY